MIIKLLDIPPEGLNLSISISSDEFEISSKYEIIEDPVKFDGNVKLMSSGCLVSGHLKGSWKLSCARCLKFFTLPVDGKFRVFFNRNFNKDTDSILELTQEQLEEKELNSNEINLTEIIREEMILRIPMKPICEGTCKGLCPSCGQDLNIASCNCEKNAVNPQFAKLKQFLQK
ncbi:DUF177 domain-containing protein [bacterium]|nr:DUF177 domain-containing protein [candidate division CSSED10-310 bacterium]